MKSGNARNPCWRGVFEAVPEPELEPELMVPPHLYHLEPLAVHVFGSIVAVTVPSPVHALLVYWRISAFPLASIVVFSPVTVVVPLLPPEEVLNVQELTGLVSVASVVAAVMHAASV